MFNYFFRILTNSKIRKLQPKIIIADSVHPLGALGAVLLAYIKKCVFIYQIRDIWPSALQMERKISQLNPIYWLFKAIEHVCLKKSLLIISSLENYKIYLKTKKLRKKIIWVPNPIKKFYNRALPKKLNKFIYLGGFGFSHDVKSILFEIKKNYIFYQKNKIMFYFFGNGVKFFKTKHFCSKYMLQKVVKIKGYKKPSEIIQHLKKSSFALASLNKNDIYKFGINLNKINTYLSCGVPFLLHGVPSKYKFFPKQKFGAKICSLNSGQLTNNIKSFINMKQSKYRQISTRLKHYGIKTRSLERLQEKVGKAIYELCS